MEERDLQQGYARGVNESGNDHLIRMFLEDLLYLQNLADEERTGKIQSSIIDMGTKYTNLLDPVSDDNN